MLIGNSPRIAWFLRLRNISHSSKYSLAPRITLTRRLRTTSDELGSGHRLGSPETTNVVRAAISYRPESSPHWSRAPDQKPSWNAFANDQQVAPSFLVAVLKKVGSGQYSTSARHSIDLIHSHQTSPAGTVFSWARPQVDARRFVLGGIFAAVPVTTQGRSPTQMSSSLRLSVAAVRSSPVVAAFQAKTDTKAELRAPPPVIGAIHSGTPTANVNHPTFSSRTSGSTRSQIGGNKTSETATVHIDGFALGQWAIQHLEHTLARPTAGMTGVDPRASPPRGRVSPF